MFSDHSLATDSVFAEVQLVSCRNVLIYFNRELQDRARRAVPRRARAAGASSASARRSRCASPAHADAFDEVVARRADLPEAGRRVTPADVAATAASTPSSSARRRAASRRCRCCCRRCRPACGAPVFVVLHLPRERPSLLVDIFSPRCAVPVREARGQGAGRARHGLFRAARLSPAGRRGAAARAVGRRARALLAAVDRRAVRVGRRRLRRAAARRSS